VTTPARKGPLGTVDHAIYRVERVVAGSAFLLMALIMFLYVAHRVFSRTNESRLPKLFMGLYESFGGTLDAAGKAWFTGPFSFGLNLFIMFLIGYGGARTVKRAVPYTRLQALGVGLAIAAVLQGLVSFMLWHWGEFGPEWAPRIALVCMLWVGFLGSSLATYERKHLGIELADKIWPAKLSPYVRALAAAAAATLCIFLFYLAWISLKEHLHTWSATSHRAGLLDPTHVPRWVALLVVPYALGMMILRIVGQMVRAITHPDDKGGGEILPGLSTVEMEHPASEESR